VKKAELYAEALTILQIAGEQMLDGTVPMDSYKSHSNRTRSVQLLRSEEAVVREVAGAELEVAGHQGRRPRRAHAGGRYGWMEDQWWWSTGSKAGSGGIAGRLKALGLGIYRITKP
jgi:hypothetical protein